MISKTAFIKQPIPLGKIGSCYGIYGWLRILSFTEKITSIFQYQPWFILKNNQWQKIELEKWDHKNHNFIIKLKNINDRNASKLLTNYEIIVDASQLPQLDGNFYYWKDIIGCKVLNLQNFYLGKVVNIINTRANDVLIIKSNMEDIFNIKERLIPFINEQIINKVDILNQVIIVNWDPSF